MVSKAFIIDNTTESLGDTCEADRGGFRKLVTESNVPCQTHEDGTQTTIVVVGLLHRSGEILADCLIVAGLVHFVDRII